MTRTSDNVTDRTVRQEKDRSQDFPKAVFRMRISGIFLLIAYRKRMRSSMKTSTTPVYHLSISYPKGNNWNRFDFPPTLNVKFSNQFQPPLSIYFPLMIDAGINLKCKCPFCIRFSTVFPVAYPNKRILGISDRNQSVYKAQKQEPDIVKKYELLNEFKSSKNAL